MQTALSEIRTRGTGSTPYDDNRYDTSASYVFF